MWERFCMDFGSLKVLIVGQTPPPYGGQAVMIENLLKGSYPNVQLYHVRMAFSKEMDQVGKFTLSKVFHLVYVILSIIYCRLRHNVHVLYYPPAGPERIPMYRDLAILISTRWMFKRTVFHFHAGGISELYDHLSPAARFLFRIAYFSADAAIRLSEQTPPDAEALGARSEHIVPYGIKDYCTDRQLAISVSRPPHVLFVGVLKESKGVLVLLEACGMLAQRGVDFELELMGRFESAAFENQVRHQVSEQGLGARVRFLGVLTGQPKCTAFTRADVFCMPTFFESEAFPVVLIEAMQFGLPVIATRWRGIPSLVQEGTTGYLVPIQNSEAVADRLHFLFENPDIARLMGRKGRRTYLEQYTVEQYHRNMEQVFLSLEVS
jgi:glycosyltransferase involved in cell wall biosynthesis